MNHERLILVIVPISVGVIILSLALAFSTIVRSFLYFVGSVIWAFVFEYSYLRRIWQFSCKTANKLARRREVPKGQRGDGFYGAKNDIVRWVYGRKERRKLRKEWDKAKTLEKMKLEDGAAVSTGRIIEGRGLSTAGSSTGLPPGSRENGSASGSADEKGRGRGIGPFKRSGGNLSEQNPV